jgi:hypothetical protein
MKKDVPSIPVEDVKNKAQFARQIHRYENADNHDLLPWDEIPDLAIGNVPEVNGFGAEEVRGFLPTRHELLVLVRHWADVAIWRNFNDWSNGTASSSGWRRIYFAWRRVERIRNLLGADAVDQVIAEEVNALYEQCGKSCRPDDWETFLKFVSRDGQKECMPPIKSLFDPESGKG